MAGFWIYQLVRFLFTLYTIVLIARSLLPLLGMSYAHPVMRVLYDITEPLLAPIRRRLPPSGMLDFSPMVLILAMWVIEILLAALLL